MPDQPQPAWTVDTLVALREADARFYEERDRRYTEVAHEREKALKIKEQADRDALDLARQIQIYKDEKANELREQINRERMLYATKEDVAAVAQRLEAIMTPVLSYVSSQQGEKGGRMSMQQMFMVIIPSLVFTLLMIGGIIVAVAYAIKK